MLKQLLLTIVLFLLLTPNALATDRAAAGCEEADIATTNGLSSSGDRITVPAGSCTWTTAITLTRGVSLVGAGIGQTLILDAGSTTDSLLHILTGAGEFAEVSGFTFDINGTNRTGNNGVIEVLNTSGADAEDAFRIHHNAFIDVARRGIYVQSVNNSIGYELSGVIDNNSFTGTGGNYQYVTCIASTTFATDPDLAGRPWTRSLGMGDKHAVYVESNTMSASGFGDGVLEGYGGCSYVLRYNTIHNSTQGHHGTDSGGYRGTKRCENYGNSFTADGVSQRGHLYRSGVCYTFNETFDTGYNITKFHYDLYRDLESGHVGDFGDWGHCDGTHAFDGPEDPMDSNAGADTGHPCLDQTGWYFAQDLDDAHGVLEPSYSWNITRDGVQADFQTHVVAEADYIREGVEYFNSSFGTLAARPATCAVNELYWVTDQGEWNSTNGAVADGRADVCETVNVWTTGAYVPYDYPHPLAAEDEEEAAASTGGRGRLRR